MFPGFISAQTPSCSWLNDFSINIVPKLPGTAPSYPGCPTPDCDELMYEVYVTTNAAYTSFEYSWLSIQARINTNGSSSYIETDLTRESCSPAWNAAQFAVENDPGGFGLVTLNLGDPFSTTYPSALGQVIPLTNGSALLFTIVVHAPAGAPVNWQNPSTGVNPYISVYAKNVQFGANCAGELAVNYGGALSPNVTMPVPGNCTDGAAYFFDVPQQTQTYMGNLLDAVPIPIVLTGLTSGTVLEEIEIVALVKTQNYMEFGNVQSDLFPCPGGILDPGNCSIKIRDYESGGFKYREISALAHNVTVGSAHDILLNIYLLGPLNESIADCAEVTLQSLRIKRNGVCCSVPVATANGYPSATICYQGSPICPEFDLAVTDLPTGNDCEIRYRVDLNWSYQQASFNVEELRFRLRFSYNGPLSVSAQNNSLCASCLSITSPGQGLHEITINLTNTLVNKGSGFDLVFSGTEGCVTGFLFLESTIDVVGSSKCVPELLPPYTTGDYSRCFARLAGNVFYKMTQDCADYLIQAQPVSGQVPGCTFYNTFENQTEAWSFCVCKPNFPYQVTCSRPGAPNWLNNVSTFDLVLISKHVLGIEPFNNTFKYVAADANCNGVVTTFDISELRKLLLGIVNELPNGVPSYKILGAVPPIPMGNFISVGSNPYCQSQFTKTTSSASDDINFYVVKTGDVNWNEGTNPVACFSNEDAEDRSARTIPVQMINPVAQAGEMIRIPLVFSQNESVAAWQMELGFDASRMQYAGFEPGIWPTEVFVGETDADAGRLRLLWYDEAGKEIQVETGTVIGYLSFHTSASLNETELAIQTGENLLPALAYDALGNSSMLINAAPDVLEPQLYANPNPFDQSTMLSLDMPADDTALLTIYDSKGVQISELRLELEKGRNQWSLGADSFGRLPGLYTVCLRSSQGVNALRLLKY